MTPNNKTMVILAAIVGLMIIMAYGSVPLYSLFCRATGFGGTTRVASVLKSPITSQAIERKITISFDGNVDPALPWEFTPETKSVLVTPGESVLVKYHAVNHGPESVVGTATYNVQPDKAGAYFYKTQCFCFTKQVLKPGEATEMAVEFYIDPSIMDDRRLNDVQNITLSYTFFRAKDQSRAHSLKQAYLPSNISHTNP